MKKYLELIRIKHWIKNLLIFLPLFFSQSFNIECIINVILGFISFSLVSSFVYIINDIKDVEKDRKHPIKKYRPIANNKISKTNALIIGIILLVFAFVINILITNSIDSTMIYLICYLIINILYSYGFKNIVLLDVLMLVSGFIIRIYYGAEIVNVSVSSYLFLTVLSTALFLGFSKRKKEKMLNNNVRSVLKQYSVIFLERMMNICSTLVIIFYSLWAMSINNQHIFYTIPLVIIIIIQYNMYYERSKYDDPVNILLNNKPLIISTELYILIILLCLT